MNLPGHRKWKNERDHRRNLAIEDMRLIGAMSLIDYDHTQVAAPGFRTRAINEIALVSERYGLDPDLVSGIMHELFPNLKDITPPPHDDKMLSL